MEKHITPVAQLVEGALSKIETVTPQSAIPLIGQPDIAFVDIRDIRELWRDGKIPGALHAPRGMLEFWVDPKSPYFKPVFAEEKRFIFYCASGWRSALATLAVQRMGLRPVAHIGGGFSAWKKDGGRVEPVQQA